MIFDLEVQLTTLLAKMLVRGLALGIEPWKVFLYH